MRRREAIALLGGASLWSLTSYAQQQGDRMRRVGVLVTAPATDAEYPSLLSAFRQRLHELGWSEGRSVSIDLRQGGVTPEGVHKHALELIALSPHVILAAGSSATGPLLQATRTLPVVFTIVPDPVGAGFVESLSRPGGNATGFVSFDYGIGGKWLELLKEAAPGIKRIAVLRDPDITAGIGQWSVIQAVAPMLGLEAIPVNARAASDIAQSMIALARSGNAGLIVTSGAGAVPSVGADTRMP